MNLGSSAHMTILGRFEACLSRDKKNALLLKERSSSTQINTNKNEIRMIHFKEVRIASCSHKLGSLKNGRERKESSVPSCKHNGILA